MYSLVSLQPVQFNQMAFFSHGLSKKFVKSVEDVETACSFQATKEKSHEGHSEEEKIKVEE